jgi:hypothetical protein
MVCISEHPSNFIVLGLVSHNKEAVEDGRNHQPARCNNTSKMRLNFVNRFIVAFKASGVWSTITDFLRKK